MIIYEEFLFIQELVNKCRILLPHMVLIDPFQKALFDQHNYALKTTCFMPFVATGLIICNISNALRNKTLAKKKENKNFTI